MDSLHMYIVMAVMLLFVIMMLRGKHSFALVGFSCVFILIVTGCITLTEGFSGFTNKNVIMLAGMFVIAGLFGKTSVIEKIKDKLLSKRTGGSDIKIAATVLILTAILAQIIPSQTGIIMIVMSFLTGLGTSGDVTVSRMLIPVTFVATMWLGRLPVGGAGLTTYLMFNQLMQTAGATVSFDVMSLVYATLIPATVGLIYSIFTYKMMPKKDVSLSAYEKSKNSNAQTAPAMSHRNEVIVYIAFALTIIALIFAANLGDIAYLIPLVITVALIYLKVVSGREVLSTIVNGPVMMCAPIFVLSDAMTNSGAGALLGNGILKMLGGHPAAIVVLITFALTAWILSSFVSNTACFMVLIPVACSVCIAAGYDPRACVAATFFCSVSTIATPMASGGAALAYSTCQLGIKETWKWTIPAGLIVVLATIINCYLVFPM